MKLISTLSAFILYQILFNIGEAKAQSVQIYRGGSAIGGPHSSVVAAIGAAANGDSLKLSAHTFNEHDILVNKNLIFAGTYTGIDSTTLDAKRLGRVMQVLKGRTVTVRDIRIVNGFANKGGVGTIKAGDVGGGIKVDTNSVLTLSGGTIVANNESVMELGGGVCGLGNSSIFTDTCVVRLRDKVIIRNNKGGGIAILNGASGSDRNVIEFRDDVQVCYNENTGAYAPAARVYGNGIDGGICVHHNHAKSNAGISFTYIHLYGIITVSQNVADSLNGGGFCCMQAYGNGKLLIKENKAYFGGGGLISNTASDSVTFIVSNNHAAYGGGVFSKDYGYGNKAKNIEITNNIADSLGGAAYFTTGLTTGFAQANIHHNTAKKYNGIYVEGTVPSLELRNTRLFNPDVSGKHNGPEVYISGTSTSFISDTCWFGESDTTGMLVTNTPGLVGMARTVATDWKVNNGAPVGTFPNFPLSAKMKIAAGGTLRSGSFKTLEGRFSASAGSFTPPTATITSGLLIESIYKATSTGSVTLMGIVDADTFKTTLAVTGIAEVGFEQVKIYPNPATDFINLDGVESGSSIVLYDVSGKVVTGFVSAQPDKTVVDISSLPAGNYILKIVTKEGAKGTAKVSKD